MRKAKPKAFWLQALILASIPFAIFAIILLKAKQPELESSYVEDWLIYTEVAFNHGSHYFAYNPATEETREILVTEHLEYNLAVSSQGQIAYTEFLGTDTEVFVKDIFDEQATRINVSQNPSGIDSTYSWSPDGRYLAYSSHTETNGLQLKIWDGESSIVLRPDNIPSFVYAIETDWSIDGRLAFTLIYGLGADAFPSEIFIWDGIQIMNLSQNPEGSDGFPEWSMDGRLAFQSVQNGNHEILVWDGLSYENGLPDKSRFENIAPELTNYMAYPQWTNADALSFATSFDTSHFQIAVWDGQKAINLSQNPNIHNGGPAWSDDGRWAFINFFSSEQLIHIRDANNETIFVTEGQYRPAWSRNGELAFCQPSWKLMLWDENSLLTVSRGSIIIAQWMSGQSVYCTSG